METFMVHHPGEIKNFITKRRPLFNMKTALENVPVEWLRNIEPKIIRGAFLPCWVWIGAVDSAGYPITRFRDKETDRVKTLMMHRFVARIFWDFPEEYQVRRTCNTINCLNPNHILPSRKHHTQA